MNAWRNIKRAITRPDLETAFSSIRSYVEQLENNNDSLVNRLQEYNQIEEIRKAQEARREAERNSLYILNEGQRERMELWHKAHQTKGCNCRHYHYEIHPLSIGTVLYIVCNKCGDKQVIGDV